LRQRLVALSAIAREQGQIAVRIGLGNAERGEVAERFLGVLEPAVQKAL